MTRLRATLTPLSIGLFSLALVSCGDSNQGDGSSETSGTSQGESQTGDGDG